MGIVGRAVGHWDDDLIPGHDPEIGQSQLIKLSSHVFFISQKKQKDVNSPGEIVNSLMINMIMKIGIKMDVIYQILAWSSGKHQYIHPTDGAQDHDLAGDHIQDLEQDLGHLEKSVIFGKDHLPFRQFEMEVINHKDFLGRPVVLSIYPRITSKNMW